MNSVFVILGKAPIKGLAKTRLAKDLGEEKAINLYKDFLKVFFRKLSPLTEHKKLYFYYTPFNEETRLYFEELFRECEIENVELAPQKELPFFSRIECMFKDVLEKEGDALIHLTGTDIPDFPTNIINDDYELNSISLGLDDDGGFYYLKSLASSYQIFELDHLVKDGESTVSEILKQRAKELDHQVLEIQKWSDVDVAHDLEKLFKRSPELLYLKEKYQL